MRGKSYSRNECPPPLPPPKSQRQRRSLLSACQAKAGPIDFSPFLPKPGSANFRETSTPFLRLSIPTEGQMGPGGAEQGPFPTWKAAKRQPVSGHVLNVRAAAAHSDVAA